MLTRLTPFGDSQTYHEYADKESKQVSQNYVTVQNNQSVREKRVRKCSGFKVGGKIFQFCYVLHKP